MTKPNIKKDVPHSSKKRSPFTFPTAAVRLSRWTPKRKRTSDATKVPRQRKSDKRAFDSAIILHSLTFGILGQPQASKLPPNTNLPRPAYNRIKVDLLDPKMANKVIMQLRALPAPEGPTNTLISGASASSHDVKGTPLISPINAVCLDCTDDVANTTLFKPLLSSPKGELSSNTTANGHNELSNIMTRLKDVKLVNLIQTPDFGFGNSIGGEGLLAGSVPTPDTVSNGFNQITQQLLSLGFATSTAVFPNHDGVHPPLDRMSVITYWWGMEITLPPPSIKYLSNVTSINHAVLNILSTLALVNNGVREILPFVRYISQFMDFEWNAIKAQDKGQGVVCAATWIMPAALVPRPWDFAPPPPPKPKDQANKKR